MVGRYAEHSACASANQTRATYGWATRILSLLFAIILVVGLSPQIAFGLEPFAATGVNTSWYDGHEDDDVYYLSTREDLAGLAQIVNSTDEEFEDKTIELSNDINGGGADLTPIGTDTKIFNGTFNGNGHIIWNFNIVADSSYKRTVSTADSGSVTISYIGYAGIFGHTGSKSLLENINVETTTLSITADDCAGLYVDYVGLLVGYSEGSISNVTSSGTVSISSVTEQKCAEAPYTIEDVGGIAGVCYGSLTDCSTTESASLTVEQTSAPVADFDEASLAHDIGGIVGFQGDITQLGEISDKDSHGDITECTNAGSLVVDTPSEAGTDRFGQAVTAESSEVGGIAGYARGNVVDCTNTAYLNIENANIAGGIVGSFRSIDVEGNSNEDLKGSDEGDKDDPIVCRNCINDGIVYGRVSVGGIVGQAGTFTTIIGCMNGTKMSRGDNNERLSAAFVIGTRWNKPYVGGIAGRTYGTICYCGNLGIVASATWNSYVTRDLKPATGYYSAGIVGGTFYYTKTTGTTIERVTDDPLVYNCFNAGEIETQANFRSRNIVGDNEGQAYDNVGLDNMCPDNMCVYGEISTESDATGTAWNNVVCCSGTYVDENGNIVTQSAENSLKGIGPMTYMYRDVENGSQVWHTDNIKDSVFQHLNTQAGIEEINWQTYWMGSCIDTQGVQVNDGWPALNWQTEGIDKTDLSVEEVKLELLENASYDGTRAIPSISATLITYDEKTGDPIETVLLQNVDFKVIPDDNGIEVTDDGKYPYEAYIEGIGQYTGSTEETCTVNYGINKGNLENCTAVVTSKKFNWEEQTPGEAQVKTSGGVIVDPSEYSMELKLDEGEKAINAGVYTVVIKTYDESAHFTGELEATWRIETADLKSDVTWDGVTQITYLDKKYDWYSTVNSLTDTDWDKVPVFAYTGHPIEPGVENVVYADHVLTEGTDYSIIYADLGADLGDDDDGSATNIPIADKNIGTEGDTAFGAIMVRYVPGGNFHNYENMIFIIDGTSTQKLDITAAVVNAPTVVYEDMPMCPVTVSYAGQLLTEGTDYEITYTNNNKIGTASYVITGIGLFEGTLSGTFEITGGLPFEFTGELVTIDGITGVAITGFTYNGIKDSFDLVIPDTFEIDGVEYPVIAIADNAFGGPSTASYAGTDKLKITTVTIPASVISIGDYAFGTGQGSTQSDPTITAVTFEEGSQLKYIGEYAFARCPITEFVFPAGVEVIGDHAFYNCTSLFTLVFDTTDADLPSSIGEKSFERVGTEDREVRVLGYPSASAVIALAENNAAYGKGIKNANGGVNFTFIERIADISSAVITAIPDQAWTGSAITPAIEVYLNGALLDASCYTVSYTNNVDIGTARVTATGAGGYFGSCSISFNIIAPHVMTVYAGADRYETANKIAASVAENGPFAGVIVCSGVNGKFADALCASGLSGVLGYPVVLVNGSEDTLDTAARSAISSLLGGVRGDVVILGGTSTVSAGIESALTQYAINATPSRVSGADRYATAEAVYNYGSGGWSSDYAVVAIGNNFPDALGAASFCASYAVPMLLTDQNSAALETYVIRGANAASQVVIVGGTTSIPEAKVSSLGSKAVRMDGTDRYATNLKFTNWQLEHGMTLDGAGVATGTSFPDSLGSASLLALTHSVLLLSSSDEATNANMYGILSDNADDIYAISILGGSNSVSEGVRTTICDTVGGIWVTDER